jgi:para-nitrobenzyl esterase
VNLARRDVVVVTLNHRLAALGYLYLAQLTEDERFAPSGNVGNLDLVLALEWVRDNIDAFGGDPDNVTIFGISGGSAKATALLALPAARGLFHRAICHSGADAVLRTPESSTENAEQFLKLVDVTPDRLDALFDVPVEQLLEASDTASRGVNVFWPVLDGTVAHEHPVDAIAAGAADDVTVIIGSARTETALNLQLDEATGTLDHGGLFEQLPALFGSSTEPLLNEYRRTRPGASDTELYVAMTTDRIRIPSIRILEAKFAGGGQPGYLYEIAFAHPFAGGVFGAMHGIDLGMMFDSLPPGAMADDPGARGIARVMTDTWAAFAHTGVPSSPDIPAWPPYVPEQRATMVIDVEWHVEYDINGAEREAWRSVDLTNTGLCSRTRIPS